MGDVVGGHVTPACGVRCQDRGDGTRRFRLLLSSFYFCSLFCFVRLPCLECAGRPAIARPLTMVFVEVERHRFPMLLNCVLFSVLDIASDAMLR